MSSRSHVGWRSGGSSVGRWVLEGTAATVKQRQMRRQGAMARQGVKRGLRRWGRGALRRRRRPFESGVNWTLSHAQVREGVPAPSHAHATMRTGYMATCCARKVVTVPFSSRCPHRCPRHQPLHPPRSTLDPPPPLFPHADPTPRPTQKHPRPPSHLVSPCRPNPRAPGAAPGHTHTAPQAHPQPGLCMPLHGVAGPQAPGLHLKGLHQEDAGRKGWGGVGGWVCGGGLLAPNSASSEAGSNVEPSSFKSPCACFLVWPPGCRPALPGGALPGQLQGPGPSDPVEC